MAKNTNKNNVMTDADRRRQAVQLACMLPEGRDDALAILALATQLVRDFIHKEEPTTPTVEVQRLRLV